MSIKYLKQIKGTAAPVRVDTKPSFGLYTKTSATDNREVYQDGEWYTTSGGELVTNGTFDTDVSGTISSSFISWSSSYGGVLQLDTIASGGNDWTSVLEISTIIGIEYAVEFDFINGTSTVNDLFTLGTTSGYSTEYATGTCSSSNKYMFTAIDTSLFITFYASVSGTKFFDNISVFKTAPTLSATPLPPQSYIEDETGQLAEFEVIDGNVVDVHKAGYVPAIVENGGKFKEVEADEYKGKNACTAWVNYDDTTTPITIVDSYNVRSVVRVSSAVHDVYFTTKMDVAYSAVSNSHDWDTDSVCRETDLDSVRINVRNNSTNAAAPGRVVSVQVFGGKS